MRKKEFMQELEDNLIGLSEEDKKEILEDYEEHFAIGKKKGRKESEISKSLGSPKKIAKEAVKELTDNEGTSLQAALLGLWNDTKKTSKKVWKNLKKDLIELEEMTKDFFANKNVSIETKKVTKKTKLKSQKSEKSSVSIWKIIVLILFNLLFMLWIMIAFYAVLLSLFISGIAIVLSGLAVILASIFVVFSGLGYTIAYLGLAGVFSGVGIVCIGWLWSLISYQLGHGLSWLVHKYIEAISGWSKK